MSCSYDGQTRYSTQNPVRYSGFPRSMFLLPLLWIILASFDPNAQQGIKMPATWTLQNFKDVLGDESNLRSFGVGLILSGGQAALVVAVSVLAAYPLSRYEMRFKKSFYYPFCL